MCMMRSQTDRAKMRRDTNENIYCRAALSRRYGKLRLCAHVSCAHLRCSIARLSIFWQFHYLLIRYSFVRLHLLYIILR